jgi:hypothetical protein
VVRMTPSHPLLSVFRRDCKVLSVGGYVTDLGQRIRTGRKAARRCVPAEMSQHDFQRFDITRGSLTHGRLLIPSKRESARCPVVGVGGVVPRVHVVDARTV